MKTGCKDKSKPKEKHQYIINHPIYFANKSKTWNSSVAFLDYQSEGKSYGKIYKIKLNQFLDIYNQENRYFDYSAIIQLDTIDGIPIYTFTAKEKQQDINYPTVKYRKTILRGIKKTYKKLSYYKINKYLKTCTI